MFEDIECLEKVIMAADASLGSKIVHLSAIEGTYEHLFIFNIALKAFFASDVLARDLVRFSIDQVKDSIAKEAVEIRHRPWRYG